MVCARCEIADNPLKRMRGLLGRAGLDRSKGCSSGPPGSIHTMFMRFPLDVLFCDRELVVVGVERDLKPWRTAAGRGAKVVVELPVGGAAGVEAGDRLFLEYGYDGVVREKIQELLEGAFPQAEAVKVIDRTGGGDHFEVIVHDAAFNGLSRIEQHKLIYAALDEPWKRATSTNYGSTRKGPARTRRKLQRQDSGSAPERGRGALHEGHARRDHVRQLGARPRCAAACRRPDHGGRRPRDAEIREDLSAISGWPTIPQVFVKGELVGGADIVEELERSGELEQTLVSKLGENYWEARGEKTVAL